MSSDISIASVEDLCRFLDASPSPYHAVATAAARLDAAGFRRLDAVDDWTERLAERPAPTGWYVVRHGALIAARLPRDGQVADHWRLVGAHTDSPGLRVKPRPDQRVAGWRQLGVEVYGGVLANSWLDRDLGLAGRLTRRDGTTLLVDLRRPIARVPQLAVHLDRGVNDKGLVLDPQTHLTPVWGTDRDGGPESLVHLLLAEGGVSTDGLQPADVAAWELCLYDVTPAAVLGGDRSLLASGRLDNLVSCWAATEALVASAPSDDHGSVIALFDHEEVGSESTTGASGPLLGAVLERLALAQGLDREAHLRQLAASCCVSADNAHAVHPNYQERHEPGHRPLVNAGPAIKVNANQRYATSSTTAATFQRACETAGTPWQVFVSRNNMPCGSTIGPLAATRLGIETVDVGVPQLSMHSARELCGADDPVHLARALEAFLSRR
jgi:aspartyl aminopeptidase